jgi:hypothetical protein
MEIISILLMCFIVLGTIVIIKTIRYANEDKRKE